MKKLLIFALIAQVAAATVNDSPLAEAQDVLCQLGEAGIEAGQIIVAPLVIATDKTVQVAKAVAQSESAHDVKDVAHQLCVDAPLQVAQNVTDATLSAKDGVVRAYRTTAAAVKTVANKTVEGINNAATTVKDTGVKAAQETTRVAKKVGAELSQAAHKTGETIKNAANTVANSEAGQDFADVMGQFAAVPGQAVEAITDLGKTIKTAWVDMINLNATELG